MPITDLSSLSSFLDFDHMTEPQELMPPVPELIEHTGIPATMIEQLILKALYYKGEMVGRELAQHLGLEFSLIDPLLAGFKRDHQLAVRSSLGMGTISSRFVLTEAGRDLAKEYVCLLYTSDAADE